MLATRVGWELARRAIYVRTMYEGFEEWANEKGYPIEVSEGVATEAGGGSS